MPRASAHLLTCERVADQAGLLWCGEGANPVLLAPAAECHLQQGGTRHMSMVAALAARPFLGSSMSVPAMGRRGEQRQTGGRVGGAAGHQPGSPADLPQPRPCPSRSCCLRLRWFGCPAASQTGGKTCCCRVAASGARPGPGASSRQAGNLGVLTGVRKRAGGAAEQPQPRIPGATSALSSPDLQT